MGCVASGMAVWALILLLSGSAHAVELVPEYHSLDEPETAAFDSPADLGPEYASDLLAFTKSAKWEYLWLSTRKGLDLSIGSTGARHFMISHRLRVLENLDDRLEFRFHHFDESHREREASHAVFEFAAWPLPAWGLAFYGEPHLHKRKDDLGAALLLRPGPRREIRLFNTFVDVSRQDRNDRNDRFVRGSLPRSFGATARGWRDPREGRGEFLEAAFRYDTPTRWVFPDEGLEYSYWKWTSSLWARRRIGDGPHVNVRIQADRKFEGREPRNADSSVRSDALRTDRYFTTAQSEWERPFPGWDGGIIAGVQFAARDWRDRSGRAYYRDLLPHVWFLLPPGKGSGRFHLGYEFTWHREGGPSGIPGPRGPLGPDDGRIEHRLNIAYEAAWGDRAALRALISADLDEFLTRKTWEGGCLQFRTGF